MFFGYFKNSFCLVIGGHGFIGSHLVRKLIHLGADVTVAYHKNANIIDGLNYSATQINLSDQSSIKLDRLKYDYIFNLGGYIEHSKLSKQGRSVINVHYDGLLNLLSVLDNSNLKGFVQVGSSDEYGDQPSPQNEDMRESPISPYSCAKSASTHLVQMLAKTENFPGTVLRFFLVYGPGQSASRFLPKIISYQRCDSLCLMKLG